MPTKEMSKNAKYWDRRRLQKYAENEKKSEVYIRNIQSLYEKANKDIDKMISNVYKNYSKDTGLDVQKLKELLTKSETKKTWKELEKKGLDKYVKDNYKSRITRLEQIKAQVYERAKDIYPKEDFTQTELYRSVINDSYYKAIYNVQRGTGIGFSFNKLDNNVMNNLLSEKWSGRNYSERIWTNTDILANELSQVIGSALIGGRGVEVTAKEIRDRFNVGKYYAERLVRTEMNYYDNQADAMAYEEMGIDQYVFVATLDGRTSEMCRDYDGKVIKYSKMEIGYNFPPLHPNCRSTTRGYLGKEAEKMLTRRARNPITNKIELVNNVSYKEWVKDVMGIDENTQGRYGNINELIGTGKVYKPKFKKIVGEHTIEDDVKKTNPNYDRSKPQWYKNCQRCVPTYEMRRRGYDVESKPKFQSDIIARKPYIVYKDPQVQYFTKNAKDTIIKQMDVWGDNSRCQICVYWNGGGGHTFIAERRNGKVMFVDPQINNLDASSYFKSIKIKGSYFYRIDNLEVTDYIKDCCKGVVKNVK